LVPVWLELTHWAFATDAMPKIHMSAATTLLPLPVTFFRVSIIEIPLRVMRRAAFIDSSLAFTPRRDCELSGGGSNRR
jgi:hypothetical protein